MYDLIRTTEEDHDDDCNRNITQLALPDIDESAFETLVLFIYKDGLPTITDNNNDTGDDNNTSDGDFEKVKSILCVADQFGCTDLKLYMESMLVDKFIFGIDGDWIIDVSRCVFVCLMKRGLYGCVC